MSTFPGERRVGVGAPAPYPRDRRVAEKGPLQAPRPPGPHPRPQTKYNITVSAPGATPASLQRMLADAEAKLLFTTGEIDVGDGGPPRVALDRAHR